WYVPAFDDSGISTNNFPDGWIDVLSNNNSWGYWEVTTATYQTYPAFVFYAWGIWPKLAKGNHPDGNLITKALYIGDALVEAGYIQEAMLCYYYTIAESYMEWARNNFQIGTSESDQLEGANTQPDAWDGLPCVGNEARDQFWYPVEGAMAKLKTLVGRYGEHYGIKYVNGKFEGINADLESYIYSDAEFTPGYFAPCD
ncbi:MAG TPA: hypothetical protein VKS21_11840, partial [Spirochaetota bacterium]|nr:hypothetical protein [Spirochaetota bacterium]